MTTPPQTTRARLRGAFIKRAKERKRDYTVDWVHLKLNDQAQRTVLCKDPFKSRDERVERLIASSVARNLAPMPSFRTGKVVRLLEERAGLQRVEVDLGDGPERAYALTQLTGPVGARRPRRGEHHRGRARARHRRLARRALEPRARRVERDGARPHHQGPVHEPPGRRRQHRGAPRGAGRGRVDRRHAGGRRRAAQPAARRSRPRSRTAAPDARLAYVMTDGAGLPLALSDLVADAARPELVDATITCGHAFGGDYEAVSVFSALAVARHVARRRRRRRRDGPGHRRHEHPPRVQRHGGRPDPRRRRTRWAACRSRACGCRSPTAAPATSGCRTTRATALRLAARDRVAGRGARARRREQAARLRADLDAGGHRPPPRRSSTSTRPTRSSSSTVTACRSRRWAGPPPPTRRCSRPRPPPARSRPRARAPIGGAGAMADRLERLVNLTATLLDTRRPLTPRRARRARRAAATRTTRPRAGASSSATRRRCASSASRSRSRRSTASAPSRPTASTPTTTTCPSSALDRGRARRAARRRHRGAARGRRRRARPAPSSAG